MNNILVCKHHAHNTFILKFSAYFVGCVDCSLLLSRATKVETHQPVSLFLTTDWRVVQLSYSRLFTYLQFNFFERGPVGEREFPSRTLPFYTYFSLSSTQDPSRPIVFYFFRSDPDRIPRKDVHLFFVFDRKSSILQV